MRPQAEQHFGLASTRLSQFDRFGLVHMIRSLVRLQKAQCPHLTGLNALLTRDQVIRECLSHITTILRQREALQIDMAAPSSFTDRRIYRTAYGSTISSFHQPKTNFDYRSKTPGYERDSRLCQVRYDRDSRSMSRSEKTPLSGSEDSDVEKAYQKLYNKYVKEDSDAANGNGKEGNVIQRPFTSQSETREGECSSEDDPAETRSSFSEILGIAQKWADTSLTTPVINDNSPDATPKCSPMMARKREPEPMTFSGQLLPAKEADKSDDKGRAVETLANSNATPDQPPEQHSNFLVPTPTNKTSTSTMDQLLQRDSQTTNLSEVVERKKSSIGAPRNGDGVVSETSSRSVSPNIASVQCNQNGAGIQILLNEAFATRPNTNATNSNLSSKNSPKRGSSPDTDLPPPTSKVNCAVTNTYGSTESHNVSPGSSIANLLTENPTSRTKYVKSTDFAESNDHRIQSEERSWAKGSDINLDQKNKNYQNTYPPGLVNSSTEKQQELRLTSNELSTNITVPLVVLEKRRKRRDPTRTLENFNGKLQTGEKSEEQNAATKQMLDSIKNQENGNGSYMTNKSLLPTVFVTQPSKPSTMIKTTAQAVEESTDGDWTEAEDEADYESDYEYSVSQTFSLKDALPIGDLYPLSRSSSRCSPFISDYDSDASMPLFMLPSRHLTALLLITLNHWAYMWLPDFDGTHFHEEVDVGCTLRLVDKAAMRADNYEDSEYYDEEEYSDEECWDENGEYHEDEDYDNHEESEDEEKEVTDVVDEMRSIEENPDEKSTDKGEPLVQHIHPLLFRITEGVRGYRRDLSSIRELFRLGVGVQSS
uniref:PCM1_C domain-containing protein n=1 Tax=Angiostrongylus cantonensis TaxID=6313 RepID=A0A158P756_ANGCA